MVLWHNNAFGKFANPIGINVDVHDFRAFADLFNVNIISPNNSIASTTPLEKCFFITLIFEK